MKFQKFKSWLNEDLRDGVTVLYPGGFKPMTGGHLDLIRRYVENPDVKELIVIVGPKERNGITQDIAVEIAEKLTENLSNVKIEKSSWPSPILTAYKMVEHLSPGVYALASSTKEGDYARVRSFTDQHQPGGKYFEGLPEGVKIIEMPIDVEPLSFKSEKDAIHKGLPISASTLRNDILVGAYEAFKEGYPENSEDQIRYVWDKLKNIITESYKSSKTKSKLNEFAIEENGVLEKFEYQDDLVYYVKCEFGNVRLSNKFIDEISESKLDQLLGELKKWWIIPWYPYANREENKYRVIGLSEVVNESVVSKVNKHMTHAEDLVVLSGEEGLQWVLKMMWELYEELKGTTNKSDMKLSVKIDGAPAIFAWSEFHNDLPKNGIAMKGLFAKTPKVFTSVKEIQDNFGDRPDLAYKLKTFLKYLSEINIPKNEIWQGDFLFDDNSLKETTIEGKEYYAFHPNTIYYVVPKDSELGRLIDKAQIGITWHTRYTGSNLENVSANYNAEASELKIIDKVLMTDPYIKSFAGIINFTEEESEYVESTMEKLLNLSKTLYGEKYNKIINSKDIIALFSIFQNSLIKANAEIDNASGFIGEFREFLQNRGAKEREKRKSEAGKQKVDLKFAEMIDDIDQDKETWEKLVTIIINITKLKEMFVRKLNNIGKFQTYLKMKEGSLRSTNQEGFAVSDIDGNVVKLVSRSEFSYSNFSPDVVKGWQK